MTVKYKEHVVCDECKQKDDCTSRTAKVNYADLKQIQRLTNSKGLIDVEEIRNIVEKYL